MSAPARHCVLLRFTESQLSINPVALELLADENQHRAPLLERPPHGTAVDLQQALHPLNDQSGSLVGDIHDSLVTPKPVSIAQLQRVEEVIQSGKVHCRLGLKDT